MSKISINRLTNVNVYLDGASLLGRAEECKLPAVKTIQAEHKALGMVGKTAFFSGLDKLEAEFKWNAFYPEVMSKAANPFNAVSLQVRGSVETWGSDGRTDEKSMVVHLQGTFKEFPLGEFKPHDNALFNTKMNVTYFKCLCDGEELYEVDILANIYKVKGVDLLANYRANIGE